MVPTSRVVIQEVKVVYIDTLSACGVCAQCDLETPSLKHRLEKVILPGLLVRLSRFALTLVIFLPFPLYKRCN